MPHTPFECVQCWQEERIGEVINREAVSVDRATFLATHTPFRHISYLKSPHHISNTSETSLLEELLTCARTNQHAFVVVQGIPGTGKSHLIRWLKERYEAEMRDGGSSERVLLIERAHNSLRGTLQQIITSGVFDDEQMRDHQVRLEKATDTLSEKALADNILDHLRVATYEVSLDDEHRPRKTISSRIERFLLDPVVREELKRSGGPVDRLVRFLSTGSTTRSSRDELPGFHASDFEIKAETLRKIKNEGGYSETQYLAENLNQRPEFCAELASYLNRLLDYAIGHTTALSEGNLVQIFGDLRCSLRQQGYNLALFVEDITAFTGIDSGLVDVLATQHTGEHNRKFCRLVSVIGITDGYYHERFPDNMRERIGYHLSLNAPAKSTTQREESDLLQDMAMTADLVARYLNAMRVSQTDLEDWLKGGGRSEALPNLCTNCHHKPICHAAFGSVSLTEETDEGEHRMGQAGLYPFNAQAIWTMYQRIDTDRTSRTPRSLINSVLLYVMQSHAHTVAMGTFPPPAGEMGSEFSSPSLRKPLQRTTIERQGGADARRIESLVLFWGNRTVDATRQDTRRQVGSIPEAIFKAFGIAFIEGEILEQPATGTASAVSPSTSEQSLFPGSSRSPEDITPAQQPAQKEITPEPRGEPEKPQTSKYTDELSTWHDGGKLQNYEDLRDFLFKYLSSAIDWESHGISNAHIQGRFSGRQIEIEGQTGKVQKKEKDILLFPRSSTLYLVLQALADLNEPVLQLDRETIGGHLANLGTWLLQEEPRIVAFIQQPPDGVKVSPPLRDLLIYDCLLIEWLRGNLRISSHTPEALLQTLIRNAAAGDITDQQWKNMAEQVSKTHAQTWPKVLKRLKGEAVNECRRNFLQTLNCPQGGSTKVLFINTATALDTIASLKRQDWVFPPLEIEGDVKEQVWGSAIGVYRDLLDYLEPIFQEEQQHIQQQIDMLSQYIGGFAPEEVQQAVQDLLVAFRDHHRSYKFAIEAPAQVSKLDKSISYLQALLKETNREETLLRLSGLADPMKTIQDFIAYFNEFMKEFEGHQKHLDGRIANLRQADAEIDPLRQEVQRTYDQVIREVHEIGENRFEERKEESA